MSLFSLLLRVLLCVSLIANGVGFAQASTRMQLAHAAHGPNAPALPDALRSAQNCHPGMTMASHSGDAMPAMDHAAMGHSVPMHDESASVADVGLQDAADCCNGNSCQCACVQYASAAFTAAISTGPVPVHAAVLLGGTSQHASPRLPHLIRPPIG